MTRVAPLQFCPAAGRAMCQFSLKRSFNDFMPCRDVYRSFLDSVAQVKAYLSLSPAVTLLLFPLSRPMMSKENPAGGGVLVKLSSLWSAY